MAKRIPARLTAAEGRKFAFTVGAAFLVFGAIGWWRGSHVSASIFAGVGGLLGLLGAIVPDRLGPLERAWMGLAHMLSKVTTPIFMGVVFFLVITPVAALMRAFGRSPMSISRQPTTYWVRRDSAKTRSDLTRQF